MSKIAVIGGNGQLGNDLTRAAQRLNLDVTSLTHADIEITDLASLTKALSALKPEIILNTAGCHGANQYTAADQAAFFWVNGLGAMNLARFCRQHEIILVHYSTDYVFGRERTPERPYTEEDPPCPVNIYGASKLAGEFLVQALCPKHYVIRIASIYGRAGCRAKGNSNFVKMVLNKARRGENLKVVSDQLMSPTWTRAIAMKTFELVNSGAGFGLYHMAGGGSCSWYEFAREILRIARATVKAEPIATPEEGRDEVFLRPRWTALDNLRLRQEGLHDLPHWCECLEEYILTEERS